MHVIKCLVSLKMISRVNRYIISSKYCFGNYHDVTAL